MSGPPLNADDIPWNGNGQPAASTATRSKRARTSPTLVDLERIFAKWIRDPDPIPTRAVLATYVANRKLEGDPVWLMLVGGSGVGKTERLIPLSGMPDVVLESSISGPAALLSGSSKKERAKDASGGVLRKFPADGGVLLLKDFTSIIDMHRESRAEVMAALREIHDGSWSRSVGADGGRTLTWTGHLGIIAGCTTAIDTAYSVISTMGTRFLLVRLQGDNDLALSALDHVGHEIAMRDDLREAVRDLLERPPGKEHPVKARREALAALGNFVALARSPVDRDHQGEIRLVLDPEAPTRLVKMLAQLWRASGLLGLDQQEAWKVVRRVGMDSIPKLRLEILHYLSGCKAAPATKTIATAVEHPTRTTRRALEDLTAHRIVERQSRDQSGNMDLWKLTERARKWLDQTLPDESVPDLSEHPIVLIKVKSLETDKTGTGSGRVESRPDSIGSNGDF